MELLASCNLAQARQFNGRLVVPNEDEKRPDKVFLNVEYNGEDMSEFIETVGSNSLVKCVSFDKEFPLSSVPESLKDKIFVYSTIDDIANPCFVQQEGVTYLIKLNDDFPNQQKYKVTLKDLSKMCKDYSNVRFYGGNLLAVEGLRIGRFDTGKDKMSPVFKDIYDTFVEVRLDDLEGITEIVKKTRKKAESGEKVKRTPRVAKPKKPKKQLEAFITLFGGEDEEEF